MNLFTVNTLHRNIADFVCDQGVRGWNWRFHKGRFSRAFACFHMLACFSSFNFFLDRLEQFFNLPNFIGRGVCDLQSNFVGQL